MPKKSKKPATTVAAGTLAELWPGQSVALLKALHILTRDGALNADSRRKLKQVLHLASLIRPALDRAFAEKEEPVLADLGAGKSYLGFLLYDLFFAKHGRGVVYAVESRHDLIETSRDIAATGGFIVFTLSKARYAVQDCHTLR